MESYGDGLTPFEQLADEAGITYLELWQYLEREVERRRERYAIHKRALEELDRTSVAVASGGDESETPPGHHQHSI